MIAPKVTHRGAIFNGLLDCYVLDDGRRVVSQRGIVKALSGAEDGKLDRYLDRLPCRFAELKAGPEIEFQGPTGPAKGREAQWLVDLLLAYDEADDAGELHHTQRHLARQARVLLRALAKVGIIALVDEATHYQAVRAPDELAMVLRAVLAQEAGDWERLWNVHIVDPLCRLHGERFVGGKQPRWLASTYDKIYRLLLGDDVVKKLKELNPAPRHGSNHHQWLTPTARTIVANQLHVVAALAETSESKSNFWQRMNHRYANKPLQLALVAPGRKRGAP